MGFLRFPGFMVRYLRIVMGTGVLLLGVGGYIPLLFLSSTGTSQPGASVVEGDGDAGFFRHPTLEPSPSCSNPSSEAEDKDKGSYDSFHKYINQESEQAKEHKERAKYQNRAKSNSFGFWGSLDDGDIEVGGMFKHRF